MCSTYFRTTDADGPDARSTGIVRVAGTRTHEPASGTTTAKSLRTLVRTLAHQAARDAFQSAHAEAERLTADAATRVDPDASCHD